MNFANLFSCRQIICGILGLRTSDIRIVRLTPSTQRSSHSSGSAAIELIGENLEQNRAYLSSANFESEGIFNLQEGDPSSEEAVSEQGSSQGSSQNASSASSTGSSSTIWIAVVASVVALVLCGIISAVVLTVRRRKMNQASSSTLKGRDMETANGQDVMQSDLDLGLSSADGTLTLGEDAPASLVDVDESEGYGEL